MANDLRLQVIMDLANKASAPLRSISASSAEAAKTLKAAREQLKQLNVQQAAVEGFTKQQTAYRASSDKLKILKQNLDVLRQTQGQHSQAVQVAEKAIAKQTAEFDKQKTSLLGLRARLNEFGITNVSDAQARLKTETAAATAAIEQQRAKLKELGEQHKRLADLKAQHGKNMMQVGIAAGAGVGMQAAGRHGIQWGLGPVKDFAAHEDAMVGVQRQVAGARDESGRLTATYYEMERQIRELSGQLPVATTKIADMFTAGARMEVPTNNLQEFVRMASEIAIAFDAVPDEITESMGKVAKNFKIPITDIRGLADAINFLDDNAISKGDDIIDFMSRVAGTASMVKITAKETAALGSTLLTLGERRETASTAINAVFSNLGAANTQSKKFREMVATLKLSTNQLESGMQTDALHTIFKVMEAVRKLPKVAKAGGTSQIDAVATLFGKEHWDTFSKLLENRAELDRQIGLANSQQAQGSMGRESAARNQALSAQWEMAKNRAFNLSAAVGETLKPALVDLLNAINPVLEKTSQFIKEHPELIGWIMKAVLAFSAIIFALGTLAVSLAAIFGPMALLKFIVSYLGIRFNLWGSAISVVAKSFSVLRTGMQFLIGHPILLVIAAIAAGAYLIYNNWDNITAFFSKIWTDIKEGASSLWQSFKDSGAQLMDSLIQGITSRLSAVKETVVLAANGISDWFKSTLGIHSPSRVFMAAGLNIGEGAAIGIERSIALVRTATAGLAAATSIGMPGMAGAEPLRIDTRPPLAATSARGAAAAGSSISITINPAPGSDPQAIARAVAAELDRRDRAQSARRRSTLGDIS